MKALIGQIQTQRVLPVNAGAYGVCRLSIAQILHEPHDADQGELPGMEGRLSFAGVDGGEQLIVKQRAQLIAQPEVDIAVRECRVGDTRGFPWNRV